MGGGSATELNTGYGRLGYVFLNAFPNWTYTVIDIPPTLLVAQNDFEHVFPEKKIFKFRPLTLFADIKEK